MDGYPPAMPAECFIGVHELTTATAEQAGSRLKGDPAPAVALRARNDGHALVGECALLRTPIESSNDVEVGCARLNVRV
jgi:hypothetical protein